MNDLRTIRIFVTVVFFAASLGYILSGGLATPLAAVSFRSQIIPSALSLTMGATLFWIVATFIFGRIYCSSVCPIGTIQDSATWLRRKWLKLYHRNLLPGNRFHKKIPPVYPFKFRKSGAYRLVFLFSYIFLLLLGLLAYVSFFEPWNMLRSALRLFYPQGNIPTPLYFSSHIILGGLIGILCLLLIWIWALLHGRRFCNEICPIGTGLAAVADRAIFQIEINPDACSGCLKCEDVCKAECIKVVSRYVDNSRCVRCFNCMKVCRDNAIGWQRNRRRPASPLLQKTKTLRN